MTTLESVQNVLTKNLELASDALQPDARLEDLAIDSLSMIEVMFALEDEFKITVPADPVALHAKLATVGDLVAYVDALIEEQYPSRVGAEVV